MQHLTDCLSDEKGWLAANFLLLYDTKTEAIIFSAKAALCSSMIFLFFLLSKKPPSPI